MKAFGTLALTLGMVASTAGPGRAQPPGDYGPGRGMGGIVVLRNKSVQQELKANPEQARKLDALFDTLLKEGQQTSMRLREISPGGDRRAKFLEYQRAQQEGLRKGLAEALKPEQVKRFDQIDVQQAGILAFELPRVREALKLTDDQKAKVQDINREMMVSSRDAGGDFQKDPRAAAGKVIAARAQALVKCLAVLTDEQKATWNDLAGEPFVIKVP